MTKEIPLSKGKIALVDDEDYEWLNQWKWYYHKGYAARESSLKDGPRKTIWMHRLILGVQKDEYCDHRNRNTLDNHRSNLRVASKLQNNTNRGPLAHSQNGYKGVKLDKRISKWYARIRKNGQSTSVGYFNTAIEAAYAYDKLAMEHFGEFAYLNFPER
jgi:hypothetical protein